MLVELVLFFFVLLGSKILLGAVVVYMLVPHEIECTICDAETLPLQHPRGTILVLRLLRLQRRWCMECRRESLARYRLLRAADQTAPLPVIEPRVR